MTSGGDIEEVVANYLRYAQPSERTVVVEDALQLYIAKLDKETQERILPDFVRRTKAHTKPRNLKRRRKDTAAEGLPEEVDEELVLALDFLNERQSERARENKKLKSSVDCELVRGALAALREGYAWTRDNDLGDLWRSDDSTTPTGSSEEGSPIQRLAISYKKTLTTLRSGEYRRVILALLMHHECRKSGIQSIGDFRCAAQSWLRVINSWGMGGLMLLGPSHRHVFERGLSKEQVKDLWTFCDTHMANIALKVGSMHETIKDLLTESMQRFGLDVAALETVQTPLAEAFRTRWQQNTAQRPSEIARNTGPRLANGPGSTGLDTPAAAASQQELRDDQEPREKARDPKQALPTSDAADGGLANPEGPVRTPYQNTTDLMEMSQEFGMRTSLETQWPSETNCNDASTFPLGYDESGMSMGNPSAPLPSNTSQFLTDEWLTAIRTDSYFMEGFGNFGTFDV